MHWEMLTTTKLELNFNNMSTKKIIAIFVIGIIALIVTSVIMWNQLNKSKVQEVAKDDGKVVNIKDGVQNDVKSPTTSITYEGKSFSPDVVTIKKGQNIEIKNLTEKKVNMKISGAKEYQIQIDAKGKVPTPLFEESGAFLMYDLLNPDNKAQLIVTE